MFFCYNYYILKNACGVHFFYFHNNKDIKKIILDFNLLKKNFSKNYYNARTRGILLLLIQEILLQK